MHSSVFFPLFAGLAAAAPVTTASTDTPTNVNPTPDALPLDFLADVEIPTYSTLDGLLSQVIPYATPTAIAAVAAAQSETPLSVFPAVTTVAMNAAGDGAANDGNTATPTGTAVRRDLDDLQKRGACDAQATIANYYNVDVSSPDSFTRDPTIASVANNAPTPTAYYQNFKNQQGANSAYAYMGYTVLQHGYDVNACATQCSNMAGCLSFNIYFERDPVQEPGAGCDNPAAFANIKCSFWGSALDISTATNSGQWRDKFQVAIAGSNAYTSNKIGGKITGWTDPLNLNNAAMQAPLRDCGGTWTYMGYKLFQSGPFDVNLCAAACDAQTAYNIAHPPSSGYTPLCAAFDTYQLTMTNNTGSYVQGQMCTMYTSAWDAKYATNTVAYNDGIGAKYTYSMSFFYSRPEIQPVCDADLSYLQASGADFCTSYISYSQPTTTVVSTTTPALSTLYTTASTDVVTSLSTGTVTITRSREVFKRQDSAASAPSGSAYSIDVSTVTVKTTLPANNATLPSHPATSSYTNAKRAIQTPASITAWSPAKISAACSRVATGTSTVTSVTAAPTPLTTTMVTTTSTTVAAGPTVTSCVVPGASLTTFASGAWGPFYWATYEMNLPFSVTAYGVTSNKLVMSSSGLLGWNYADSSPYWGEGLPLFDYGFGDATLFGFHAFLYGYPWGPGYSISYEISGPTGHRAVVFDWKMGLYWYGSEYYHFSITLYEDKPNIATYKYYSMGVLADVFGVVGAQREANGQYMHWHFGPNPISLVEHISTATMDAEPRKTYILAPKLDFKPGGAIALGNVLGHALRPHRPLITIPQAQWPSVDESTELDRTIQRDAGRDLNVSITAQILQAVNVDNGVEGGRNVARRYTMSALKTLSFRTDPSEESVADLLKDDRVKAAMRRPHWSHPVYVVTGRRSQRDVSVGVQAGGSRTRKEGDSLRAGNDIVLAYQLLKIARKGWRGKAIAVDEFYPKSGFLADEEDQDGHKVEVEPGLVTQAELSQDLDEKKSIRGIEVEGNEGMSIIIEGKE
ncbi:carbohydrate-binding-like protein [Neofusicoccum parvum]|uniref:Carbohydrate-binding-like protein n=1 Tax=Neofusicoccum parvum TaxID=310453 RepID=A0ACB5S2H7_9PEZI|nr:carbohydrate-binding-like protein [Neofusicoccum parvum]